MVGMKSWEAVAAIDKDPEAPIFSVADYSLEDDCQRWARCYDTAGS